MNHQAGELAEHVALRCGGDGIQGPRFNKMAKSETDRQAFVENVHHFLTKYGYDGVDIDWEVPNPPDRASCTTLMQELRNELPSPWLISMAVTADPRNYGQGLDIPALAPLLDFMNVMTYDFYGTWSGATGLVSPLFQDPADPRELRVRMRTSPEDCGNAIASDEQLARIGKVSRREFMRRGVNQHTLERICRKEPVRVLKLAESLRVLEEYERGQ